MSLGSSRAERSDKRKFIFIESFYHLFACNEILIGLIAEKLSRRPVRCSSGFLENRKKPLRGHVGAAAFHSGFNIKFLAKPRFCFRGTLQGYCLPGFYNTENFLRVRAVAFGNDPADCFHKGKILHPVIRNFFRILSS